MFEDEGSLRRRPRGFRRKQQIKAYSNSGSFYPPANYEGPPGINVTEIQNIYPTPYPYESYSSAPPVPSGPPTFSEVPWQYQSEYARNPSPTQHVSSQSGVLEYSGNYQGYQPYENGGELLSQRSTGPLFTIGKFLENSRRRFPSSHREVCALSSLIALFFDPPFASSERKLSLKSLIHAR